MTAQRVRMEGDEAVDDFDDIRKLAMGDGAVPPPPAEGEAAAEKGDKPDETVQAPVEPTYAFNVRDKVTGNAGRFVSRVPTVKERLDMGIAASRIAKGAPWASLPDDIKGLVNCLVACSFCLLDKPAWFKDAMNAMSMHVILTVGEEVLSHHERWFRGLARVGPEATYRSLVEITPAVGG